MYAAGAFGCVAAGLYWKKANVVGAHCALALGGVAPVAFLILSFLGTGLPSWSLWLVDVNVSGFLSFFLALLGMVVGSLVSQKRYPPVDIKTLKRN
jgi:Na+(H+)/acetate symporter ActP